MENNKYQTIIKTLVGRGGHRKYKTEFWPPIPFHCPLCLSPGKNINLSWQILSSNGEISYILKPNKNYENPIFSCDLPNCITNISINNNIMCYNEKCRIWFCFKPHFYRFSCIYFSDPSLGWAIFCTSCDCEGLLRQLWWWRGNTVYSVMWHHPSSWLATNNFHRCNARKCIN